MNIFRKMNEDPKDKGKNNDRKSFFWDYLKDFKEISSNAYKLI